MEEKYERTPTYPNFLHRFHRHTFEYNLGFLANLDDEYRRCKAVSRSRESSDSAKYSTNHQFSFLQTVRKSPDWTIPRDESDDIHSICRMLLDVCSCTRIDDRRSRSRFDCQRQYRRDQSFPHSNSVEELHLVEHFNWEDHWIIILPFTVAIPFVYSVS